LAATGTTCVTVAHGTPCLGPVTRAGCGAICPVYGRGCYGCFGPSPAWDGNRPNTGSLVTWLGMPEIDRQRAFATFNVAAFKEGPDDAPA